MTGAPNPAAAQRANDQTAMSVPRPATSGGVPGLPQVLAPSDAARLRRVFDLQSRGELAAAAREADRLDDRRLLGHVLADRYLRPEASASVPEVQSWLAQYADHPDALRLHDLLGRLSPRGTALPAPPSPPEPLSPDAVLAPEDRAPAMAAILRNPGLDRTVRDRALVVDPARGIAQRAVPLGEFLDGLATGAPEGYLMARAEQLPPALRRALATPRYCAGAPWKVTRLWIASQETVSTLHRDLADNLHTLVDGEKVFLLAAPAESDRVYPYGLRDGLANGARIDPERPDYARFPRSRELRWQTARLGPGETLFLPHGWWHHVRTARATVALNTWWTRGLRLPLVVGADWFKRLRGLSR